MEIITPTKPTAPKPAPTPTVLFIALALAVGAVGSTMAAGTTSTTVRGTTNSIMGNSTMNDVSPQAGANSFTEAQAKARISKSGYTKISGLTQGNDGIWRGTGIKNGVTHNVMLDYKGNVTAQ